MARRWFSRVACTIESEEVDVLVKDPTKFRLNGLRVLTTNDTSSGPPGPQGPQGPVGSPGIPTSLGAVGSSPNANGASLSGNQLILQPASLTRPGVLSNSEQYVGGIKHFTDGIFPSPDALSYPAVIAPIPQNLFRGYTQYKCTGGRSGGVTVIQNGSSIIDGNIEVWVTIIGNLVTVTLPALTITYGSPIGFEWDIGNLTPGVPFGYGDKYGNQIVLGYDPTSLNKAIPVQVGMETMGSQLQFYTLDQSSFGLTVGFNGIQTFSYTFGTFQ